MTQLAIAVRGRALLEEALSPSREANRVCTPWARTARAWEQSGPEKKKMANLNGFPPGKGVSMVRSPIRKRNGNFTLSL